MRLRMILLHSSSARCTPYGGIACASAGSAGTRSAAARFVRLSTLGAFCILIFAASPAFAADQNPSAGQPATPAAIEEGRTRHARGIQLYKEGNYHAALAEFRAAYAAAPSWRLQYNLGQTLMQLQDYAGGLDAFELYLGEGKDKIEEERLREVEGEVVKLRARVATVSIVLQNPELANLAKVEVLVNDEARPMRAGKLRLGAGRNRISVQAPGYQTEVRVLDLAGATSPELRFELKPVYSAQNNARREKDDGKRSLAVGPTEPKLTANRSPVYVALGATVAAGIGAGVFTGLAASKHSEWERANKQANANKSALEDLRSATRTRALVADVLWGVTGAAAITTVILYFVTGTESSEGAQTPDAKKPSARFRPLQPPRPTMNAGPNGASLGLSGVF
jgi:tetratricopeptide (TPR) repeat protein